MQTSHNRRVYLTAIPEEEMARAVQMCIRMQGVFMTEDEVYRVITTYDRVKTQRYSFSLSDATDIEFHIRTLYGTHNYSTPIDPDDEFELYTVAQWRTMAGSLYDQGSGYWVKGTNKSNDDVFSTPRLDATHVIWYAK